MYNKSNLLIKNSNTMYSDVMNKSLEASKRFVESMSSEELLSFMAEFDNYETSEPALMLGQIKVNYELYRNQHYYKIHELFDIFMKPKKSIDVETNTQDPLNMGLFLYI